MENEQIEAIRGRLDRSIVFVGLMGAGKTSLGAAFAKSLGIKFVDSDDVIVAQEKCSISDIFQKSGEDYFRQLEREAILQLAQDGEIKVIATGGGAFMNNVTRQAIRENALSVFLSADLDVLVQRIGSGEGRPLFEGKEVQDVLAELIEKRYPVYKEAHLRVETKNEALEETLNRVQQTLYTHLTAG